MNPSSEVMNINDLRRKIFSYLRKKPKIQCCVCNRVCVWDKKICNFFSYKREIEYGPFAGIPSGDYCINCWSSSGPFTNFYCIIN